MYAPYEAKELKWKRWVKTIKDINKIISNRIQSSTEGKKIAIL